MHYVTIEMELVGGLQKLSSISEFGGKLKFFSKLDLSSVQIWVNKKVATNQALNFKYIKAKSLTSLFWTFGAKPSGYWKSGSTTG